MVVPELVIIRALNSLSVEFLVVFIGKSKSISIGIVLWRAEGNGFRYMSFFCSIFLICWLKYAEGATP